MVFDGFLDPEASTMKQILQVATLWTGPSSCSTDGCCWKWAHNFWWTDEWFMRTPNRSSKSSCGMLWAGISSILQLTRTKMFEKHTHFLYFPTEVFTAWPPSEVSIWRCMWCLKTSPWWFMSLPEAKICTGNAPQGHTDHHRPESMRWILLLLYSRLRWRWRGREIVVIISVMIMTHYCYYHYYLYVYYLIYIITSSLL